MSSHNAFRLLSLVCAIFPSVVLAGRGGVGGKVSGGSIGGSGGGDGDSLAPFFLQPFDAAIFAFYVIFGVFTGLQTILAGRNIYQRVSHRPPSITLPEFSVGPIFPTCLFVSTLILTIYYVLYGVYWGVTKNQNVSPIDIPKFSNAYFNALNVMAFLADIFIVAGILALLSHRERVLGPTFPVISDIKMIFEGVLVVTLLALGMGSSGLWAVAESDQDIKILDKINIAYASFYFIAAVDITASSLFLDFRARRSPVNDHKIAVLAAFVISPLLFIYALYPLILFRIKTDTVNAANNVRLASVVLSCIIEFGIFATCLKLGMPVIPKQTKVARDS